MSGPMDPLEAAIALAEQYSEPASKRAVFRAAAAVRLRFASEADDPLKELQIVAQYERSAQ